MKLQDLFEKQRVIEGDIRISAETTKLDFEDTIVRGDFECSSTQIKSLKGSPKEVHGNFNCANNAKLTSLMGTPVHVGGYFSCANNAKIDSLEGAPKYVGVDFLCYNTKIASLHNIHKQIEYIGDLLLLPKSVKSHVLGVMFIKGLLEIQVNRGNSEQAQVAYIINNHLKGNRNPHDAQEELIEAGLSEYAKL